MRIVFLWMMVWGGGNEYLVNVSYSWLSNREVKGSVVGVLVANDPVGGGGVCRVAVNGVCGVVRNGCWAGLSGGGSVNYSHFEWVCVGSGGGGNVSCDAFKFTNESVSLRPGGRVVDDDGGDGCEGLVFGGFRQDDDVGVDGDVLVVDNLRDVFVVGTTVFVVGEGGLQVFDAGDRSNVSLLGQLGVGDGLLGDLQSVFVSDGLVYVVGEGGVQVLDVSDPGNVSVVGGFGEDLGLLEGVSDVVVRDGLAYVVSAGDVWGVGGGLQVFDVSSPGSVSLLGSLVDDEELVLGGARGVVVRDGLAFVVSEGEDGVQVLNVSDPRDLVGLGSLVDDEVLVLEGARGVSVSGDGLAFVVGEGGVQVLDVSDPRSLVGLGSLVDDEELVLGGARGVFFDDLRRLVYVVGVEGVQLLAAFDPEDLGVLDGVVDDECLVLEGLSSFFVDSNTSVIYTTSWEEEGVQIVDVDSPVVDGFCSVDRAYVCVRGVSVNHSNSSVDGSPYAFWGCEGCGWWCGCE